MMSSQEQKQAKKNIQNLTLWVAWFGSLLLSDSTVSTPITLPSFQIVLSLFTLTYTHAHTLVLTCAHTQTSFEARRANKIPFFFPEGN